MKRLELNVKVIVILLLATGLVVGFLSNEKQPSSVIDAEEIVMELKVAIGTEESRE